MDAKLRKKNNAATRITDHRLPLRSLPLMDEKYVNDCLHLHKQNSFRENNEPNQFIIIINDKNLCKLNGNKRLILYRKL